MVLWLLLSALMQATKPSHLILDQPPWRRVSHGEYGSSDDLRTLEPRGISPEALEVCRQIIGDSVWARDIPAGLSFINNVKDELIKDFLRLCMVSEILSRTPSDHIRPSVPSKVLQDPISVLQEVIDRADRVYKTHRMQTSKLAVETVSIGTARQTGSISAICFLVQGTGWLVPIEKDLAELTKHLSGLRKQLADKLAVRKAEEDAAKQAERRAEKEKMLSTQACVQDAMPVAEEITTPLYKAAAFRRIANVQRRIDLAAAKKSLEKAVRAALESVPSQEVSWWNHPWVWIVGSAVIYILKPTGDAVGKGVVLPCLQRLLALLRWLVCWPFARLARAVGRSGNGAPAQSGTFHQVLGAGIPIPCTALDVLPRNGEPAVINVLSVESEKNPVS
jgi:hypothetical protein